MASEIAYIEFEHVNTAVSHSGLSVEKRSTMYLRRVFPFNLFKIFRGKRVEPVRACKNIHVLDKV